MFFDQKIHFFYPNLRTLNMYALASFGFGFRRSKITRNDTKILPAYAKTTCWWNSSRLYPINVMTGTCKESTF